jgi:REP element-mobilizing transposase RayT
MTARKRKPEKPLRRKSQLKLFADSPKEYGGSLRKKRKGRKGARPLTTKQTIHLTLRSTKAVGANSFRKNHNQVSGILKRQAQKTQIRLLQWANTGNHLHLHIKLPNHALHRRQYNRFIRAITGLIARKSLHAEKSAKKIANAKDHFWDLRPYTRVLTSWREYKILTEYINLNQLESLGYERGFAREILKDLTILRSD